MDYKRIYDIIIERAKERVPEGYVERHHIVPRCLGGSDEKENLVALTPEEHFLCHVLLVKIYPEHKGLIYAVQAMCRGHKGRRRRKMYGWLKRKFSKQRKIDAKGSGNSQHRTMWINKVGTTENKKIPVGEHIPDGWVKGRTIITKIQKTCIVCGDTFYSENKSFCSTACHTAYKPNLSKGAGNIKGKRVSVDGKEYVSISSAAIAHGINHQTATLRFRSKNFKEWVIL